MGYGSHLGLEIEKKKLQWQVFRTPQFAYFHFNLPMTHDMVRFRILKRLFSVCVGWEVGVGWMVGALVDLHSYILA